MTVLTQQPYPLSRMVIQRTLTTPMRTGIRSSPYLQTHIQSMRMNRNNLCLYHHHKIVSAPPYQAKFHTHAKHSKNLLVSETSTM
eukprot:8652899-Ditylum_brightwellii.AAC.2